MPRSIAVVGGGPAGLYVARLLKLADPRSDVVVHERNSTDITTFGFGVGLTESTMANLTAADPETADRIRRTSHAGHDLVLRLDRDVRLHGARNLAIGRADLLEVLMKAAIEAGVDYRSGSRVTLADIDADIVVAADGVRSAVRRELAPQLGVHETLGRGHYMWCGADFAVDTAYFTARTEGDALFVAHAYPYSADRSTFLLEADDVTWDAAGLGHNDEAAAAGESDTASIALLERIFADQLNGRPLLANRSRWARFTNLAMDRWSAGNVVLIGDAAHTAHYTLGSGTKLALEDAIALARALQEHSDTATAFAAYEHARRPAVERFKQLAGRSQRWWESYRLRADQTPEQLAVSYMTRAGNLALTDYAAEQPHTVTAVLDGFGAPAADAPTEVDDWILRRPLDHPALSLPSRIITGADLAHTAVRTVAWAQPDVWSSTADEQVAALAHDGVIRIIGPDTPEGIGARIDLAERIRAELGAVVLVDVGDEHIAQAAAGIATQRCDAIVVSSNSALPEQKGTPMSTDLNVAIGEITLSAKLTQPQSVTSRGLVVALHGGTYDANYYDYGPDSLPQLGALLGYTVVALDRPGYGRSAGADPTLLSFAAQTRLIATAVENLARDLAATKVVLIGHSIGGMLALQAAAQTSAPVVGVEVSGLGEHWQPGLREMWASMISDAPALELPPEAHAHVMLGPAGTYAADQVARDASLLRPLPMPELIDVVTWSTLLPTVAAKLTVPVSLTLAEHDAIWQSTPDARDALARHFTSASAVTVHGFAGAGHSIEFHHNARAFVLRQLAFAEACLTA